MHYYEHAATAGVASQLSAPQRPSRTSLPYEARLRLYEQKKDDWSWRNLGASADERERYCQALAKELRV